MAPSLDFYSAWKMEELKVQLLVSDMAALMVCQMDGISAGHSDQWWDD